MISEVSGMPMPNSVTPSSTALTADQKALVEKTLSNYSSRDLSERDAIQIVEIFSNAGIPPGKALDSAMRSFGFDAQSVGSLAKVDHHAPAPPPPGNAQSGIRLTDLVSYIEDYLSQVDEDDSTYESLVESLRERFGVQEGQSFINISV